MSGHLDHAALRWLTLAVLVAALAAAGFAAANPAPEVGVFATDQPAGWPEEIREIP